MLAQIFVCLLDSIAHTATAHYDISYIFYRLPLVLYRWIIIDSHRKVKVFSPRLILALGTHAAYLGVNETRPTMTRTTHWSECLIKFGMLSTRCKSRLWFDCFCALLCAVCGCLWWQLGNCANFRGRNNKFNARHTYWFCLQRWINFQLQHKAINFGQSAIFRGFFLNATAHKPL